MILTEEETKILKTAMNYYKQALEMRLEYQEYAALEMKINRIVYLIEEANTSIYHGGKESVS